MAETLGSMIDKLSIKSIREFHIKKMANSKKGAFSKEQLMQKLKILKNQKKALISEIEQFIVLAHQQKLVLKDEKLKLYNKPSTMNKIGKITTIAKGIEALTTKNFELWRLEDEARREDVDLSYIGKVKKKIDVANQQRNDLMDKLDEILEKAVAAAHQAKNKTR
ncbi:MAG: DUF4254 domain-containing protein [Candidatus Wallbacteria bacterium]|nr:DUF4254 domain-containing protein [Candidatus Wallbacteria bacterium]